MDDYQKKLHALFLEHVAVGTTQEYIDAFLDESVDIDYNQGAAINIALSKGNKEMVDILMKSGANTKWVSYNPYKNTYEASYDKILPIIYSLSYNKTPTQANHWLRMSMTDIHTYEIALQSRIDKDINFLLDYLSQQPLAYWQLTEKYITLPVQRSILCLARSNNNEVLEWFSQKKEPIDDVFMLYRSVVETINLFTYQQLETHYPIDLHANKEKSHEIFLWNLRCNTSSEIIEYWQHQKIEFFDIDEPSNLQNYVLENIAQNLLSTK